MLVITHESVLPKINYEKIGVGVEGMGKKSRHHSPHFFKSIYSVLGQAGDLLS